MVVLIEVLVLSRLALLLDGSGCAGALLVLEAESNGGVAPPPPHQVFLLLNCSIKEDGWGLLPITLSCCAADRATDAALLRIVSTEVQ